MKTRTCIVFGVLLTTMFVSACGTVEVKVEPTAPPTEAVAPPTELALTLSPAVTATEVTPLTATEVVAATPVGGAAASDSTGATPEAPAEPHPGWVDYSSTEYGFSLRYPPTWTLTEVHEEHAGKPGSRFVELSQGTAKLIIGYRYSGEDAVIWGSGVAAGDFEARGTARILDEDVARQVLVYEGRDKVVFYGVPPEVIAANGLEFAVSLNPFGQVDYSQMALDQAVQDEADMILSTLTVGASADGG